MPERSTIERPRRFFGLAKKGSRGRGVAAKADGSTTQRLVQLVADGAVCNQTSAARILGVTHQRVQQIVKAEGLSLNAYQPNTLISWPCPNCGKPVEMWTTQRSAKTTAYCQPCARHFGILGRPKARTTRRCSAPGCERPHAARGWCRTHYRRWTMNQSMAIPIGLFRGTQGCSENGCSESHYAKGLCRSHYNKSRTLARWEQTHA